MAGKSVIPANEMVQKVKAAVDARLDPDFIIIARTDSAGTHGVDEAIRRLNLYAEAGADCMYADALLSREDIAKVAKGVPKPLIVNMTDRTTHPPRLHAPPPHPRARRWRASPPLTRLWPPAPRGCGSSTSRSNGPIARIGRECVCTAAPATRRP